MKTKSMNLKSMTIKVKIIITSLLIITTIIGCSSDDTPTTTPTVLTVTTDTPANITDTQVTLGGKITNDAGKSITQKGVCVSLDINPTIDDPTNDDVLDMGTGIGDFTDTFTGFPASTTVHVRAFATNSDGTAYGEDKVFTTLPSGSSACPVINAPTSITTPTTWTTGNVYMVTNMTVTSILTIQPGVIIKINGGSITINGSGKIIANGTVLNRIVFTSYADDSVCGDSNGDGTATSAQKGDWQLLYINGGTNNSFNYCDFFYGGKNSAGRNSVVEVSIGGPSFTFDNCKFAHTLSSASTVAYTFFAQNYMSDNSTSIFTNNAFYDNDRPILLDAKYTLNPNNIFHDPNNPSVKNTRNGIYFLGGTIQAGSTSSWNVSEVPYVCNGQCTAYNGSTLNIGPNTIVKFVSSGDLLGSNSSSVNLNPTAILTSYKDDANGGDTNGDGNASSPAAGNWNGFSNTVPGNTTWINGVNILYDSH
jgi:hypothetical protein